MTRVAGTFFGLLFLFWGLVTVIGGLGEARADWAVLGLGIAAFGGLFLPAVRYLWQGEEA